MADENPTTHPDIAALNNAIERGDFHDAQVVARRLVAHNDATLREAGQTALDRFKPDTNVMGVFVFTGALIALLAAMYLGHR
jgi:hypothetical protein